MAKFFDTSYGNDECPSEGAIAKDRLFRIFYCEDVPENPKYTVWERPRAPYHDLEDARDAVFEMAVFARDARDEAGGRWEPVLETDDDAEFEQFYERIRGMEGLRGLGSAKKLRRGPRPGMTEVRELELYADNTEPLYRMKLFIEKNLMGKLARGQYSRKKAEKAFKHYADRAAQGYTREFGSGNRTSYGVFSKKEREALAKREERQFFARVKARDRELLDMVPKKYRKTGQSCEVRRTNGTFKLDCNIDLRGLSRRRRRR